MKSQSSLPVQYGIGSKPESSPRSEKDAGSIGDSFQKQLNERIIDVYERSEINAAVPDERTTRDRRTYSTRRQSSAESTPLTSDAKLTDVEASSKDKKSYQSVNRTEKNTPSFFSPSPDKGRLLDIWA
ncbi:MAG: hypothetical protein CVU52_04030 [Deltaproteobacteria bacterium HGW-Deltaproteobacteria-10]|nr:MAG: hypothetical protein CVU52_04030 [Deltaproteobacteria bacterium HGW-Deltaproteobacteria-10]